jgi:hypothetical protein
MTATILYDTWQNQPALITAAVFSEGPDPDLPATNVLDYSTFSVGSGDSTDEFLAIDYTLSAPATLDSFGVAGHNLPVGTQIYAVDNTDPLARVTLGGTDPTTSTGPILLPINWNTEGPRTVSDWRILFVSPQAGSPFNIQIGSLFCGTATPLPEGITAPSTPPPLGRKATLLPSIASKGSNFLGSHVQRLGWQFDIRQKLVDPAWVQANWLPMVRHVEQLPFFYLWDDAYPEDAVYAWTNSIIPPSYTDPSYMQWGMKCSGLHIP